MNHQKGSVLIEALLAALVFTMAAIGSMGIILNSSTTATDLKMRMEAAELAEDIMGRMQSDMGGAISNLANYDDSVTAAVPAYKTQWLNNVSATLPNGAAKINVGTAYAGGLAADVKVTITWLGSQGSSGTSTSGDKQRTYTLITAMAPNQ